MPDGSGLLDRSHGETLPKAENGVKNCEKNLPKTTGTLVLEQKGAS